MDDKGWEGNEEKVCLISGSDRAESWKSYSLRKI